MPGLTALGEDETRATIASLLTNQAHVAHHAGAGPTDPEELDKWAEQIINEAGGVPIPSTGAAALGNATVVDSNAGQAPPATALDDAISMDVSGENDSGSGSRRSSMSEVEDVTFGKSAEKLLEALNARSNQFTEDNHVTFVQHVIRKPTATAQFRPSTVRGRIPSVGANSDILTYLGVSHTVDQSSAKIVIASIEAFVKRLREFCGIARSGSGNCNGQPKQKSAYDLSNADETTDLVLRAGLPCVLGVTNSGEMVLGVVGFKPCIRTVPNGPKGDELHRQKFNLADNQREVVVKAQLAWDAEALFRINNVFDRPAVQGQQRTALMIVLYEESGDVFVQATTYPNFAAKKAYEALVQMVTPHVHVLKPSETYYCSTKPQTDRFAGVLVPTLNTQTDQLQQEAVDVASGATKLVGDAFEQVAPLAARAITEGTDPSVVFNGVKALLHVSTEQELCLMPPDERKAISNGTQMQQSAEHSPLAPIIAKLAEKVVTVAKGQAELTRVQTDLARAVTHEGTTQESAQQVLNEVAPTAITASALSDALAAVATFVHDHGFSTGSAKCTEFDPTKLPADELVKFTTAYNDSNEYVLQVLAESPGLEVFAINILGGVAEAIVAKVNKLIKKRLAEEAKTRNEELANRARAQSHHMMTRLRAAKTN